jgi:capsular polysaccharide transport system permease protein
MNPPVNPSADTAWTVQKRVVFALMLRETKTLFGRHKLGYLWEVINAVFHISIFWAIRSIGSFQPPDGMSTPAFLIGGFIPFFIFSHGVSNCMSAIWANRSLLTYPQVFPMDLLVSRVILKSAMQSMVFILMLGITWVMGQHIVIVNPHSILLGFSLMFMFALGFGAICSAFNLMWPTTQQLVPMLIRVLFFTSGLFFSVSTLPIQAQEILFYNPLAHVIELVRNGFVDGYGENFISLPYAASFALIVLVAGLLLERYSRRYLDRMV